MLVCCVVVAVYMIMDDVCRLCGIVVALGFGWLLVILCVTCFVGVLRRC